MLENLLHYVFGGIDMLKETLKRKLAVVALIGMLFSCVNLNIYADEGQVSQVQADEQNKMAFKKCSEETA